MFIRRRRKLTRKPTPLPPPLPSTPQRRRRVARRPPGELLGLQRRAGADRERERDAGLWAAVRPGASRSLRMRVCGCCVCADVSMRVCLYVQSNQATTRPTAPPLPDRPQRHRQDDLPARPGRGGHQGPADKLPGRLVGLGVQMGAAIRCLAWVLGVQRPAVALLPSSDHPPKPPTDTQLAPNRRPTDAQQRPTDAQQRPTDAPITFQVLHVEQEVAGDDTPVIEAVLECDIERDELLKEEGRLMAALGITVGGLVGWFGGGCVPFCGVLPRWQRWLNSS
jgi:hypothetical protein